MDGESDNTQFIRGSWGHTVTWFSIVSVVVWMMVPQQICPLEPVMWPYFEKAFLQTELSEGFRDKTIWIIRVHLKSTIVFLSETEEKTVWRWRERLELRCRLPGAAVARKGKEGFSHEAFGGNVALLTPYFRLLVSRMVREQISVVLRNQVYDRLLLQPQKTNMVRVLVSPRPQWQGRGCLKGEWLCRRGSW